MAAGAMGVGGLAAEDLAEAVTVDLGLVVVGSAAGSAAGWAVGLGAEVTVV